MDVNDVSPHVIHAANNLTISNDQNDPRGGRRWMRILQGSMLFLDRQDAVYFTSVLEDLWLQEHADDSIPKTGLSLDCRCLSHGALDFLCHFLQQANRLTALHLRNPSALLLRYLHNNTSIKELCIEELTNEYGEERDDDSIVDLLRNKSDFEVLYFARVYNLRLMRLVPTFTRGFVHLKKLAFFACGINDDDIEALMQAFTHDGNRHHCHLEEFQVGHNEITSRGLRALCALRSFPMLKTIILTGNLHLLDDPEIAQLFVGQVVLAPGTALKDLQVSSCSYGAIGYAVFVKALESSRTLVSLGICDHQLDDVQPIRDQLVESLPKMKVVQHLAADWLCFDQNDHELQMAVRQNTSLYKLSSRVGVAYDAPFFAGILKRNQDLKHVAHMLKGTATTTTIIPHSLWTRVLAKVGQGSNEGASCVYKVLKARLASWPEANLNKGTKRKRQDEKKES